ncbi:hypothetical protein [Rufibacter roseus]|uniref:Uncharacterized protein n=1 Tax=Rufibacter roseus TaxID=1567108 RepID=A0ABW2DI89_9BACT|nr:hypothetical protein [Rufibacter roseus]
MKYLTNLPDSHQAYDILIFVGIGVLLYGIACAMLGIGRYKPLKGKLNGSITFEHDSITIAEKTITIDLITKINFEGTDWLGLYKRNGLTEYFENSLSQGVQNYLILHLSDGQIIKTQFQLLDACGLQEMEDEIKSYYLKDKISYLQAVDLLGLSSQDKWNDLKRLKTSQNSTKYQQKKG